MSPRRVAPRSPYPDECPVFETAGGVVVTADGVPWRAPRSWSKRQPWYIPTRKLTGGSHGNVNVRNLRPLRRRARHARAHRGAPVTFPLPPPWRPSPLPRGQRQAPSPLPVRALGGLGFDCQRQPEPGTGAARAADSEADLHSTSRS